MSRITTCSIVLAGACLTSTAFAAAASATPEWLQGGATMPASLEIRAAFALLAEDKNAPGGKVDIACGGRIEGRVGIKNPVGAPPRNGTITAFEGPKGELTTASETHPIECDFGERGVCEAASPPLLVPIRLPWETEVMLIESPGDTFYNLIFSGGKGVPGYEILCQDGGLPVTDICEGNTGMELENVAAGVESYYKLNETITPLGNCSRGGEKQFFLESTFSYRQTEGANLAVSG